jgi:hypothetical protein
MSNEARSWPVFQGAATLKAAGLGLGVVGLGLTAARGFVGEGGVKIAYHAYLIAFAYWLGLALAALLLLCIWHAAKAKWPVAIRRPVEIFASTIPLFLLLFIPIVLGMKQLYPWAGSEEQIAALPAEHQHLIHHRHGWLNPTTYLVRAGLYFLIWIGIGHLVTKASFDQDKDGASKHTERMWWWGPAGLPWVALAVAFAAFDWLMSVETVWFSSMWGVYYFAGSFVSLFALLLITLKGLSQRDSFRGAMRVTHWLATGQFLLAFTAFWGYIAFDQYMLTYVANLPDAIPFLVRRETGQWLYVGFLLMGGHFLVPFFLLLSRARKTAPQRIVRICAWILFIHLVDLYWMVMPQVQDGAVPDWSNVTAFLGVGGLAVAVAVMRFQGKAALPIKDPFLAESLDYRVVTAGTGYLTDTAEGH